MSSGVVGWSPCEMDDLQAAARWAHERAGLINMTVTPVLDGAGSMRMPGEG